MRTALVLAALLAVGRPVSARTTDRYVADHDGSRLEITALRDDVLRIRIGHPILAEDTSWVVPIETRRKVVALDAAEEQDKATLRTARLTVTIDRRTLGITIADYFGRVILADADDEGPSFRKDRFRVRKIMAAGTHFFGLGGKTGRFDRRGAAFSLWNRDAHNFSESTDPLYQSIPFVLAADQTGHAFGLFLDNTWRSFFDFGNRERNVFSFGAEGGPVDYYVMAGPDAKAVIGQYTYLTGRPPLPPLWALGFQQSRYSYATEAEVRGIASRLRQDRIPTDALYLDIDYQDRDRPFTVDTKAFPDLGRLIADLRRQGLRTVLITDAHIADAPSEDYRPFDSGIAADVFVKNPDGSNFIGEVWPGPALFPDFSRAAVRDWWGDLFRDFVKLGAAGFWNDMNEPTVFDTRSGTLPLHAVHRIDEPGFAPRPASHAEIHNVYGMLNSRATYEGLLRIAPEQRPFVLTRATFAGGQRYAATWTGDNTSSWNHLKLSIPMVINLGLSGFSYAGADVGGFGGTGPSADLLTRWFEIGAFQPMFRDHAEKGKPPQEPWVGGDEQEAIRRRYIEERYRLMPYLYALADESSRTGLPLMRPVFLEFPASLARNDDGTTSQFMLGPDLLIAPSPTLESPAPYRITLPGPGWYDYWTGKRLEGAAVITTPALERLPVFVRPGAVIPRQPLVQSTDETPQGPLELAVYPGPDCGGGLYFDDGVSLAYRRGDYLRQSVTCETAGGILTVHFLPRQGSYRPWSQAARIVIHGWRRGDAKATLDGTPETSRFDRETQVLTIDLPDLPQAASLRVE